MMPVAWLFAYSAITSQIAIVQLCLASWWSRRYIDGKWYWLWHAVDQDEYVLNEIVQIRRNTKAAKRLLVRILKKQKCAPKRFVIDKLRLYDAPYVTLCPILIISHTKDWTIDPRIHTCRFANESERSKAFVQLDYCSISYQSFQPYETTIFQ